MKLLASSALVALATVVKADSWGSAWSLGPTHNGAAVVKATTHFVPGAAPDPAEDILALWIGISNATSGLIQAGCDSTSGQAGYCNAAENQWCCGASYFGSINGVLSQWQGTFVATNCDDMLTIDCTLQSDGLTWVQTVSKNGVVISTLDSYDGPLLQGGFGTGTECNEDCGGSVSTQSYTNTTIVLSQADPLFSSTLGVGAGVVASSLTTSDGGKTWMVASIEIPPMTINSNLGPNTGKPAACSASTTTTTSTKTTITSTKTTTTGSGGPTGCTSPEYAQCGGIGFTGCTTCASPYTCDYSNDYYSQCV
ncbi:CBM1 domain-containing protein [Mycena chlorophos]|uniref:CBM1 domain-containing protein n=1 Tax=Mycena chlorophos TaxID=658473 RepID=A0A8H6WM00_MYCCL|nr:CBM1 domain-containing protein [Mycena chlorophos]